MLVFSLREDPGEAGSNTGKRQMSLSATVREELCPPSMSCYLDCNQVSPTLKGESSCLTPHTPDRSAQQPVFQLVPETVKLTTKLRAITQARRPRNRSTAPLDGMRKSGWNERR